MTKKCSYKHNQPSITVPCKYYALLLLISILFSCKQTFTTDDAAIVKDSVLKLANSTATDISSKGPIAWLDYFENSTNFFMASDGSIAFNNYKEADSFIRNTLVKQTPHINLRWSNLRIDPLSVEMAVMASNFHEDLMDASGKVTPFDGYFTATAHKTEKGWRFLNMHWSIKKTK